MLYTMQAFNLLLISLSGHNFCVIKVFGVCDKLSKKGLY